MLRSTLAVMAGFVVMAIIVMLSTIWLVRHFKVGQSPGPATPTSGYLTGNVTCSAFAALAGGWVTALLSPNRPLMHGLVLALVMVAMSLLSMRQSAGQQPRWYAATLLTMMPVLAFAGSWLRTLHS